MAGPRYTALAGGQGARARTSRLRWVCRGLTAAIVLLVVVLVARDRHTVQDFVSYSTRPAWDAPDGPRSLLPHLHAEGVPAGDAADCARHGWRVSARTPPVVDAFLFATELELLEVRLRELWDVVDKFVIVESTHSLMGQPKNLTFSENRERFRAYESKISHHVFQGREMTPQDGAFTLVIEMRIGVRKVLNSLGLDPDTLVIMADVDEIPSRATAQLLKGCDAPLPLHLQMDNYLYSFEFATDHRSWRAQVHRWGTGADFVHGKSADIALADAGWHCSYCFRSLREFAFKMQGASHADRLYNRINWRKYLEPAYIQRTICAGADLYGMLPEAYSWGELITLWRGSTRRAGAVHLPRAVIEDSARFAFLLPGGCNRTET